MSDTSNDNDAPDIEKNGCKVWVDEEGRPHRENGPAIILPEGGKFYFIHGKMCNKDGQFPKPRNVVKLEHLKKSKNKRGQLHCEDTPAVILKSGHQEWWFNGTLHREGGPAVIYPDGKGEKWYRHGLLHREDGPAKISHSGYKVCYKKWFRNGVLHREDGPAVIGDDGTEKWHEDGQLHREDSPAVTYSDGSECWYNKGKIHRDGGPAFISENCEAWFVNGHLHRENAPAFIYKNDYEEKADISINGQQLGIKGFFRDIEILKNSVEQWWIKGKLHREDGPALIRKDGTKLWFRYNRLHRENGPAVIYPNGSCEWWFKNKLHRADGPAIELQEGNFIFYHTYKIKKDTDTRYKEILENTNIRRRKIAEEHSLERIGSFKTVGSYTRDDGRKYKVYNYLGRGTRILSDQYWKKGKLIKEDPIPEHLKQYLDPDNAIPSRQEIK